MLQVTSERLLIDHQCTSILGIFYSYDQVVILLFVSQTLIIRNALTEKQLLRKLGNTSNHTNNQLVNLGILSMQSKQTAF